MMWWLNQRIKHASIQVGSIRCIISYTLITKHKSKVLLDSDAIQHVRSTDSRRLHMTCIESPQFFTEMDGSDSIESATCIPHAFKAFHRVRFSPMESKLVRNPPFLSNDCVARKSALANSLATGMNTTDETVVKSTHKATHSTLSTTPAQISTIKGSTISSIANVSVSPLFKSLPNTDAPVSALSQTKSSDIASKSSLLSLASLKHIDKPKTHSSGSTVGSLKSLSENLVQPSNLLSLSGNAATFSKSKSTGTAISLLSLANLQQQKSQFNEKQSIIQTAISALEAPNKSASTKSFSPSIHGSRKSATQQITLAQLSASPSVWSASSESNSLLSSKPLPKSLFETSNTAAQSINISHSSQARQAKNALNPLSTRLLDTFQNTTATITSCKPSIGAIPSTFAQFLIKRTACELDNQLANRITFVSIEPSASSVITNKPTFTFNKPSPDDIVKQARSKKSVKVDKLSTADSGSTSDDVNVVVSDMEALGFKQVKTPLASQMGARNKALLTSTETPVIPGKSVPPSKMVRVQSSDNGPGMVRVQSNSSVKSSPKFKRVNIKEELAKRSAQKDHLNLIVVGHVDAGKSTMMGHLLVLLGEVSERTIKKYEREAEKIRKKSFAFAWVLDETEDERSRGVTIDVAVSKFETPKHSFTLLDAPGHKDFIPNMISGASQADVALLVVDSIQGEFEAGFDNGGQTREHAILIRSLGVSQIIVAINKLDAIDWSMVRFEQIQAQLQTFLVQVGFKKQRIVFIPCSGFSGENLKERQVDGLCRWYSGPTLIEALDALEAPPRSIERPFRISVQDLFKGAMAAGTSGDVTVSGRIESGSVQLGDTMMAMPIFETGQVRAIEIGGEGVSWAVAGDQVSMSLGGLDIQQLSTGSILCDPSAPVSITSHFRAQIVTFDINIPLTIGIPIVVHHLGRSEAGYIERLVSLLNKSTGAVVKKNPRALGQSVTAVVEIRTQRPMCLETFQTTKELGRFMLRNGSTTVAAGIVTDILSFE
ncbi:hypothetical protein O5D80_000481 [Batrachochytrium dendrobatidis]|nr:hypothetical protein O5D80_000481 [Batrachochytrium dendrobatidis]